MAFHNVLNNAGSTLTAAVATTDLTISVTADVFPAVPFYLTLGTNPSVYEIVEVTLKTGLVFTVGRGKDGTTAKTYVAGDLVQLFMTAGIVSELQTEVIVHEANTAPHGATASATANAIALRDANGNVVSNLPVTNSMNPNLLFNPTARLNLAGWVVETGAAWAASFNGYGTDGQFGSPNIATAGSWSILKSSYISLVAGQTVTLKSLINVNALTAGGAGINIAFYDSTKTVISNIGGNAIATGGGSAAVSIITATAPANTAYCTARLVMDNAAVGQAFFYRIKLEAGSIATTFSDDNTLNTVQYGGVLPLAQILSGGNKKQTGSNSATVATAGTSAQVSVTFPIPFATVPNITTGIVYLSLSDAGYINVRTGGTSITGTTFIINSAIAQTIGFSWEATGT